MYRFTGHLRSKWNGCIHVVNIVILVLINTIVKKAYFTSNLELLGLHFSDLNYADILKNQWNAPLIRLQITNILQVTNMRNAHSCAHCWKTDSLIRCSTFHIGLPCNPFTVMFVILHNIKYKIQSAARPSPMSTVWRHWCLSVCLSVCLAHIHTRYLTQ